VFDPEGDNGDGEYEPTLFDDGLDEARVGHFIRTSYAGDPSDAILGIVRAPVCKGAEGKPRAGCPRHEVKSLPAD
jgi:hypothetical protein